MLFLLHPGGVGGTRGGGVRGPQKIGVKNFLTQKRTQNYFFSSFRQAQSTPRGGPTLKRSLIRIDQIYLESRNQQKVSLRMVGLRYRGGDYQCTKFGRITFCSVNIWSFSVNSWGNFRLFFFGAKHRINFWVIYFATSANNFPEIGKHLVETLKNVGKVWWIFYCQFCQNKF